MYIIYYLLLNMGHEEVANKDKMLKLNIKNDNTQWIN